MKKIFSMFAVMAIAAPSFAYDHGYHGGYYGGYHGGYHHDDDAGDIFAISAIVLSSLWLAEISDDHHHYKMAIVQGEEAALAVLEGAPANDLFVNAKQTAETVLKVQFGSEEQAALTILQMNQVLDEKGLK
ncbi:MAG: hypothetical protein ACXVCY_05280 [Pseudobdellovibrionaceae bacterium]